VGEVSGAGKISHWRSRKSASKHVSVSLRTSMRKYLSQDCNKDRVLVVSTDFLPTSSKHDLVVMARSRGTSPVVVPVPPLHAQVAVLFAARILSDLVHRVMPALGRSTGP